jgi:hypothetical protein
MIRNTFDKAVWYFVLITILIGFASEGFAEDQSVTVTGKCAIVGNNEATAKDKALSDAFRAAVEKGLGVWIKGQTEVKENIVVRDEILSRSEGYVTDHEILKEGPQDGLYVVTMRAKVSVDKIGVDFKKLVGRVKTQMDNPSITFVLTTWEKKGQSGSYSKADSTDVSAKKKEADSTSVAVDEKASAKTREQLAVKEKGSTKVNTSTRLSESASVSISGQGKSADDSYNGNAEHSDNGTYEGSANVKAKSDYAGQVDTNSGREQSYSGKAQVDKASSLDSSEKVTKSGSYFKIDENVWKKYPDTTIIDSFQQEFKEKGFDLKAADEARQIALTESLAGTAVNPQDRKAVRQAAEKEGANFVARGEVTIIDSVRSDATNNQEVTAKIGVEIIDVNSGDVVASYSNTAKSSNRSDEEAKVQAIKKIGVLAARTLADQTISTWQERSLSGREYTIEIRNLTSMRKQKIPVMNAVESLAKIKSQTSPQANVLLLNVLFKGDKNTLGNKLLETVGEKPGFSEKEFDGPKDEGGKIVFEFLSKQ